ncbi:hypothetical protein [Streptomyces sp. NPDC052042]|uniref:hypothetical protein n=1 Tax=Streptomyces sp. NPDC052042 TaxID=3365683 RepID=UPI0037D7B97B
MTTTDQMAASIAEAAAARLLSEKGIERGVGEIDEPGIEPALQAFAWELGDGVTTGWTYEAGLTALVAEALKLGGSTTALTPADLVTLIDASQKWATELYDYIIPSAEESDVDDAAAYREQAQKIDETLTRARAALAAARTTGMS